MDPIQWTRQLIDTPSVTGDEAGVARLCAEQLRGFNFDVSLHEVAPGRHNVLAIQDPPRVLLCSHLDTVPPFFKSTEDSKWIHGRGACDTKGIISAMFAAVERLQRVGVRDVGILLVVGEETDSIGAKSANQSLHLPTVKYTLVGEPTESKFARAQKGSFKFTLRSTGKAAHSGYPEHGRSALVSLLPALTALQATDWGADDLLGKATLNIGVLQAGLRANIVPAEAMAEVFIRVVDSVEQVRSRLDAFSKTFDSEISWTEETSNDPVHLMTLEGEEETVVAFNTDIPFLTRFGKPLLMGPGSILDAHSATERIAKQDILNAVGIYERAILKLREME